VIPVLQIVMQQFCLNNVTDCDAAVPVIPVLQTVMQQCCDTSVTDRGTTSSDNNAVTEAGTIHYSIILCLLDRESL